ncbi:hypothetical protein MHSWG343_00210 [Candidatus Mycoplasma haematohominis]|uniref:Uncharacterized protein n=1 Tax=Candidatus Mycoplasma haematohominis TaxID=1494318 RepID=A0A478FP41_9MOLU|nr:hypothetical protein MHSWG343_00210 [Candidatus Mycoplasma haemohominis]
MTPQAAVGTGLGGLAAAGAGGTAVAYAAGAFSETTYKDFEDYVNKKGLIYIEEVEDTKSNSIKKLLDEDHNNSNGYREKLKGKWDSLPSSFSDGSATKTKPTGVTSPNSFAASSAALEKSSEISDFTKAWCKVTKKKTDKDGKAWTEATLKANSDWQIFSEVCVIPKSS